MQGREPFSQLVRLNPWPVAFVRRYGLVSRTNFLRAGCFPKECPPGVFSMMFIARICFLIAGAFDALGAAAYRISNKFILMGVNARMRMHGVYRP